MNQIRGFMLVELLAAVLMIGILTAAAVPLYTRAVERSRLAGVLAVLKTFHSALDVQMLEGVSREIDFVGMKGGNGGILPVELKCSTPSEDKWCFTRDFSYHIWCTELACFTAASPLPVKRKHISGMSDYHLFSRKPSAPEWEDHPVGEWRHFCAFHTKKGRAICKSIEKQGWTVENEFIDFKD